MLTKSIEKIAPYPNEKIQLINFTLEETKDPIF